MSYRPRPDDEAVMRRWMGMEVKRITDSLVADRKMLATLLTENEPSATTKRGDPYTFDKEVIRTLGERLPAALHRRLRLPILFHFSIDVRDSYYLNDENAVEALKLLGEIGELREMREGRLWVGRAIAFAILHRYPTAVQIAMGT
jgi:uncharacterized protein (UPF0216 family)